MTCVAALNSISNSFIGEDTVCTNSRETLAALENNLLSYASNKRLSHNNMPQTEGKLTRNIANTSHVAETAEFCLMEGIERLLNGLLPPSPVNT